MIRFIYINLAAKVRKKNYICKLNVTKICFLDVFAIIRFDILQKICNFAPDFCVYWQIVQKNTIIY